MNSLAIGSWNFANAGFYPNVHCGAERAMAHE
jgi:hypothetical protein